MSVAVSSKGQTIAINKRKEHMKVRPHVYIRHEGKLQPKKITGDETNAREQRRTPKWPCKSHSDLCSSRSAASSLRLSTA